MKHLHLFTWLCLCLFCSSVLQAQMFGDTNAKWIYEISNFSTTGYYETDLIGTTVLDNQAVQTYRTTVHEYSLATRDTNIYQRPNEFMYEENGVLYYYNSTTIDFDTLIWFDGLPGDVWDIQSPIDSSEVFTTEIIDTGSLIINSSPLRFLAVQYNGGILDTLVEDIGSLSSSIKPWEKLISEAPAFRCYCDDNLGLYQKDPSTDCFEIYTPVEERFFGGPNARWTYDRFGFSKRGYTEISVAGDTVINGKNCQIYSKTNTEKNCSLNVIQINELPPDFMYEEEDVLYLYNPDLEIFDTLLWFGASLIDSWEIISPEDESFDTLLYRVTDTGHLVINDIIHPFLEVEISSARFRDDFTYGDTIVPGIGTLIHFYKPWQIFATQVDGNHDGYSFRCYEDDQIGFFQKDPDIPCDFIHDSAPYGGPGAIWTYTRNLGSLRGYLEVTNIGDTTINDFHLHILQKTAVTQVDQNRQYDTLAPTYIHIDHESSDVIYYFDTSDQSVDTLIWYGADVGDTWEIKGPGDFVNRYEVIGTGQIDIEGYTKTYQAVNIYTNDVLSYQDTIVYGIGTISYSFLPWDSLFSSILAPFDAQEFRCYQDDIIGLYQKDPNVDCDFLDTIPQKYFGGPNARWTFDRFSFCYNGFIEISVEKDTIINDEICQKYVKQVTEKVCSLNILKEYELPPDFMYEENGVLYYYSPEAALFDTLIWFEAAIGDHWNYPDGYGPGQVKVDDIKSTSINGVQQRYMAVSFGSNDFIVKDTITYGIGSLVYFYKPWEIEGTAVDGIHDGFSFRCYEDDRIGFYQKDPDVPCDFIYNSEAYGGPNAVWTYARNLGPLPGYLEVSRLGDTVINNINLLVLEKVAITQFDQGLSYDSLAPTYLNINIPDGGDVVSYFDTSDQTIDTLIWYNAGIGDSWELTGPQGFTHRYEVTGRGEIEIVEGYTRDYLAVDIYSNEVLMYQDTIVYGIGTISYSFLPWDSLYSSILAPFDAQEFRCYRDDIIGLYQKNPDVECDLIVNSRQYRPNWEVGFYPNPVRQTLHIDIPESVGEVQFTITSPTGSILDQGTFREAPTLEMGRYPSGLYHIRLISKEKVGILKVIKSD